MLSYRTLYPHELDAWVTHCASVFTRETPEYFLNHFVRDPDRDCDFIFIALDGSEVVSTVRVFIRTIWLQGRAVPMGGIGEVSTKLEYRRQGIGERLLRTAIDAMTDGNMSVSILFGDQPLYSRLGWRECPSSLTVAVSDTLPALEPAAQVRPFREEDLPFLMGIYDFFAGRLNGAILRDEAYWRRWVLAEWNSPYVLLLNGTPVAYCCAAPRKSGELLEVTELCAAPHGESTLPCLLRATANAFKSKRVQFLTSLVPSLKGERISLKNAFMARLNIPFDGIADSDSLVDIMAKSSGIFPVDHF